jgi:hypothetical protein
VNRECVRDRPASVTRARPPAAYTAAIRPITPATRFAW